MAHVSKWVILMRTFLASALALSISAPTEADAQSQSEAAAAYKAAVAAGTIAALEAFIAKYPLAPQANDAFRDIVTLSRGSSLANEGPAGLFTSDGNQPVTRSIDPVY